MYSVFPIPQWFSNSLTLCLLVMVQALKLLVQVTERNVGGLSGRSFRCGRAIFAYRTRWLHQCARLDWRCVSLGHGGGRKSRRHYRASLRAFRLFYNRTGRKSGWQCPRRGAGRGRHRCGGLSRCADWSPFCDCRRGGGPSGRG